MTLKAAECWCCGVGGYSPAGPCEPWCGGVKAAVAAGTFGDEHGARAIEAGKRNGDIVGTRTSTWVGFTGSCWVCFGWIEKGEVVAVRRDGKAVHQRCVVAQEGAA